MSFEKFFRFISYVAVFWGFVALWVSGTFGILGTALFVGAFVTAWFFEDLQWQISEKMGTVLIVLALPTFYLLWKVRYFGFASSEVMLPGVLARMILTLTVIKLLQKKSERDWIFLYLMSFFEILLAAGLSISALYLGSFVAYLLSIVCAVIAFEMRKTARLTAERKDPGHTFFLNDSVESGAVRIRRLPTAAALLIFFAGIVGIPMFFLLPRVGGAGFGSEQGKVSTSSGFSDTVTLGGIGSIQQNDAVVMRIRMDDNPALRGDTHWRGIALDKFDNLSWSRSAKVAKQQVPRGDRDLVQIDAASGREGLVTQTIYLEPLDSPVLFGLSRIVGIQGEFPIVFKDSEGGVSVPRSNDRISYKVISDRALPGTDRLRGDNDPYSPDMENYLAMPESGYDQRIAKLASEITSGQNDRYSKAKAVESYLQNNFGYTLDLKAKGKEPLSDFLFNVKEGHCEYFATAMAMMLRTQRIATRVVNGFQLGEYNDAANVWIVRQRDAHSWVEVYFPKERVWVPFDPTPFAGQTSGSSAAGIFGSVNKYLEALETYWIQYFVAFDTQEQQSLVRSAQRSFVDYQTKTAIWLNSVQNRLLSWWADVRGDNGFFGRLSALGYGAAYAFGAIVGLLMFVWLGRKIVKLKVWARLTDRFRGNGGRTQVDFYAEMLRVLSKRGHVRRPDQTPLEFAFTVGIPNAAVLTEKYNRVRFGEKDLSPDEVREVENLLRSLRDEKRSTG